MKWSTSIGCRRVVGDGRLALSEALYAQGGLRCAMRRVFRGRRSRGHVVLAKHQHNNTYRDSQSTITIPSHISSLTATFPRALTHYPTSGCIAVTGISCSNPNSNNNASQRASINSFAPPALPPLLRPDLHLLAASSPSLVYHVRHHVHATDGTNFTLALCDFSVAFNLAFVCRSATTAAAFATMATTTFLILGLVTYVLFPFRCTVCSSQLDSAVELIACVPIFQRIVLSRSGQSLLLLNPFDVVVVRVDLTNGSLLNTYTATPSRVPAQRCR